MIVFRDTNIVLYAVENPPVWGARALARLNALVSGGAAFMISDLTRMECLVGPLKSGNAGIEADFHAFFNAAGIQVKAITAGVCERAALIRARFNFKPLDSLQLAAAVVHGADSFLTSDTRLGTFTSIMVEILA